MVDLYEADGKRGRGIFIHGLLRGSRRDYYYGYAAGRQASEGVDLGTAGWVVVVVVMVVVGSAASAGSDIQNRN